MTDPIIPPYPAQPGEAATAEQWRDYIAHVNAYNSAVSLARWMADAERNLAAREKHAQAQADTAAALNAATAAQMALVKAYLAPTPGPSRDTMIYEVWKSLPQITAMTDLNMTDIAVKAVDGFIKRLESTPPATALPN